MSVDDSAFDYLVEATDEEQEGLFPSGEVSLIAGASGSGKTTLLLQLILLLRRGEPFFGRKTHSKPYAYLIYDRSENGLKRTAKRMGIDVRELNPYRPTKLEAAAATVDKLIATLLTKPEFAETKVIFIEGLDMLVPEGKTSDLTAVAKFLDRLQRLAQDLQLTIIGSVGSPKMKPKDKYQSPRDLIFGSVGWGRKAETIIYLEQQHPENPNGQRQCWILPRNGKDERFTLRWEKGRLIQTVDAGRVTAEARIMEWVEKNIAVLIEGIQQVAMKRDESLSPSLFTFRSHFAFCRHSPPLVLRFYDSAYRYRLGSILYGCSRSNPDLRLMGSRNDTIPRTLHRTVRRRSQLEIAPSTEKSHRPRPASISRS
jgi:AAA domain